jgi:hypothetical protein
LHGGGGANQKVCNLKAFFVRHAPVCVCFLMNARHLSGNWDLHDVH